MNIEYGRKLAKRMIAIAILGILAAITLPRAQAQLGLDIYGMTSVTNLDLPKRYTATTTNTGVNVRDWIGKPVFVLSYTNSGTISTNTLDVRLQSSANGSSSWGDITGGSFTHVTNSLSGVQTIGFSIDGVDPFIRTIYTVTGDDGPSFIANTVLVGRKKDN